MNKLKTTITFFLLFVAGNVFSQSQRDAYIAAARAYREAASKTKCPDRARVFEEYARWNDCMVKALVDGARVSCPKPTTPIPPCEGDKIGGGGPTGSASDSGSVPSSAGTVNEETIRTAVEGVAELLAMTRRSPEKIEADRKRRQERISNQMKEEEALYSRRSFALTLDYGTEEQTIKNLSNGKYRLAENDTYGSSYNVGQSFSAGANLEFRAIKGSRAGFLHTGLRFLSYVNPIFVNASDSLAKLKMNYINIPAFVSFRLFEIGQGDFLSFYPLFGVNGGYLLEASTNPTSSNSNTTASVNKTEVVSGDFNKFIASGIAGFRLNIWRLYMQSQFSYPLMPNLLKHEDASYEFTKAKRTAVTTIAVGLYILK